MLDFGWQEFMIIAVVTVIVVGPKELPRVFRTITGFMKKARSLAGEFQGAMNEIAREADLEDLKKEAQKIKKGESDWVKEIDPTGEVGNSVRAMKDEVEQTRTAVNQAGRAPNSGFEKGGSQEGCFQGAGCQDGGCTQGSGRQEGKRQESVYDKDGCQKGFCKESVGQEIGAQKGGGQNRW